MIVVEDFVKNKKNLVKKSKDIRIEGALEEY